MQVKDYFEGLIKHDRSILAKSITLIESSLEKDKKKALKLIEKCIPLTGNSMRIGVSGTPGVGKSTFIESLGSILTEKKEKVAVLTIDPTSSISKGSILGDKTRMEKLSNSEFAFIRPSASNEELGGITKNTKDAILLCETAGFHTIIIETVGVGQSEILINSITDIFIYLTLADNGDELQFVKKGILELCDLILINKSDLNQKKAKKIKILLENNLPKSTIKNQQTVFTCSGINRLNIDNIWNQIQKTYRLRKKNGEVDKNRDNQNIFWIKKIIQNELQILLHKSNLFKKKLINLNPEQKKHPRKTALEFMKHIIKEDF